MDDRISQSKITTTRRRKKRSKIQIFKETYLPLIIAATALLLVFIFIIGSITRAAQHSAAKKQSAINSSIAAAEELERLTAESQSICAEATKLAASFGYDEAIAIIESFSGNIHEFPQLMRLYQQYVDAKTHLIAWDDPSKVPNLSLQLLIADPNRAFQNTEYSKSFYNNFITTDEFSRMLQQLYENGYILVNLSDITNGTQSKTLYLPQGKKPFILTQTQVNYYTYMVDGDGDKLPDQNGCGFASRLILDPNGNLTCEFITEDGTTVTGAYDLVPILEAFIATHPDFSYKGARAILAVTGYDGIFGYRTSATAKSRLGNEAHLQEVSQATEIVQALRNAGYTIACGTYENAGYGSYSAVKIQKDLALWTEEVTPIIGEVNTLVYARNSDIANATTEYSGDKFHVLQNLGFTYYLGFASNGKSWFTCHDNYIRQGRILVTGSNLRSRTSWFREMFDPLFVLDTVRENYNF